MKLSFELKHFGGDVTHFGQGFRQELGILLFGEIQIFMGQSFGNHVEGEPAAVG